QHVGGVAGDSDETDRRPWKLRWGGSIGVGTAGSGTGNCAPDGEGEKATTASDGSGLSDTSGKPGRRR
ncbi:hypothetical protein HK405_002618, partial [Cladochytrium tenue]